MINTNYLLPPSSILPQNPIMGVNSEADCSRLCLNNFINGGGCKAWDYYFGTCELASHQYSEGAQYVDTSRPQNGQAFYGQLFQPGGIPTGYSYQVLSGYTGSGATLANIAPNPNPSTQSSQIACQDACRVANWGNGGAHSPPTVCGSWTYYAPLQQCTLNAVQANVQLQPNPGGYTSGDIVLKTQIITTLTCPTGYTASGGGATCPSFNDNGDTIASTLIQNSPFYDATGVEIGWQGMCSYLTTLPSGSAGQVYYPPSVMYTTCCN